MSKLEIYLSLHKSEGHIYFSHPKISRLALIWWEDYTHSLALEKLPFVVKGVDFKKPSLSSTKENITSNGNCTESDKDEVHDSIPLIEFKRRATDWLCKTKSSYNVF